MAEELADGQPRKANYPRGVIYNCVVIPWDSLNESNGRCPVIQPTGPTHTNAMSVRLSSNQPNLIWGPSAVRSAVPIAFIQSPSSNSAPTAR